MDVEQHKHPGSGITWCVVDVPSLTVDQCIPFIREVSALKAALEIRDNPKLVHHFHLYDRQWEK